MINKRYLQLIDGEFDGVNSPKESAKLREYLSKNPQLRDHYNDLFFISETLGKVGEVDPSVNLRKRILNSLPPSRYPVPRKRAVFLASVFDLLQKRKVQLAYAFLAGLVAGVVTYSLLRSPDPAYDISNLYGTISSLETLEKLEKGPSAEIALDQAHGTVRLHYVGDLLITRLKLETQDEIEALVEFDGDYTTFVGFAAQESLKGEVKAARDEVRLKNLGGNEYSIVFRRRTGAHSPVRLKLFSMNAPIYEISLPTEPGDE